jgi:hypothetical protein
VRKIFRPKRQEEIGGWRKSENDKLHNLFHEILLGRAAQGG